MIVALSKVVGGDEDVPPAGVRRPDTVVEGFTKLGTIVLVRVVSLDIDVVTGKFLELATPVL